MNTSIQLFLTAWAQVFLVAINTWQIANEKYAGALFVGFLISLVWSFNVKRIAFSTWPDRLTYSAGAGLGTLTGLWLASSIYQ